ncbi:MAG: 3-oxoacyl-ACP synthase III, partial [Planctomycetes bacterium]|nr:3-oxoacyl-ACP synthase III [Planctomycetota bacterium]
MKYSRVYMESLGYELPANVISSHELEARLEPMYKTLHIAPGQLQTLTGINERRWWDEKHTLSEGAAAAAVKALEQSNVEAKDVEVLIYAGVCRENFEPATACAVAEKLKISTDAFVFDISNACLGVMNGVIDLANRIELKQIRAGLVVSCESSREINEIMIQRMLEQQSMEMFTGSLATLTGGSGATAILMTDGSFHNNSMHKLLGAASKSAPEHHRLCRWGLSSLSRLMFSPDALQDAVDELMAPETIPTVVKTAMTSEKWPAFMSKLMPSEKVPTAINQFMTTDSVSVLKHGIGLGLRTWKSFLDNVGWNKDQVDKVICHQVGSGHKDSILSTLGIDPEKDFTTYKHLGNMGTVSLPLTAAVAD